MSDRMRVVLLAVLVCVVFAAAWFFLTVLSGLHCGGDGGSPYAANDSTVGRLCDARESGPVLWLWVGGVLVAPLLVLGGAIAAVARGTRRLLVRCAAAGFAILALVTLPFLVLSSNCSDEQRAGGADCETY